MTFTFEEEYQAVEFAADCARAGIVAIRDRNAVRFTASKIPQACEILANACRQ